MPETLTLPAASSPEANAHLTAMLRALQDALRLPPAWSPEHAACLDRAITAYDAYLSHVTTAHPMSCRLGCTACCHDNPSGVTGLELRWLGELIDARPDGAEVRARFAALADRALPPEQWRAAREPCPLLDAVGRCSAYARRPLACRAFFALTPAPLCDPDHPDHADRVNPHLDPPAILLQFYRVLSDRLELGPPTDLHHGLAG